MLKVVKLYPAKPVRDITQTWHFQHCSGTNHGTGKPTSKTIWRCCNGQLHKVLWKIGEYNYNPILGSANTSLMEVHMATGKPHDKNNEEEELVDTNLANQSSQLSKETFRPLLQCVLSYKYTKH